MIDLALTFHQRVLLSAMIGNAQAPRMKEAMLLLRVHEKLRLTDTERRLAAFEADGDSCSWKLPDPGYGERTVPLEDEEAQMLAQTIEKAEMPLRVNDWALLEELPRLLKTDKKAA